MRRLVQALIATSCVACGGAALAQSAPPAPPAPAGPPAPAAPTAAPGPAVALVTSTGPNRPLLVAGLFFLGGSYAASLVDAAVRSREAGKGDLFVPVLGPWIAYAGRCDASRPCSSDDAGGRLLLVVEGVGQGLGLVAMAASLVVPEETSRRWFFVGDGGFHAGPSHVGTGYGIGAAGVF